MYIPTSFYLSFQKTGIEVSIIYLSIYFIIIITTVVVISSSNCNLSHVKYFLISNWSMIFKFNPFVTARASLGPQHLVQIDTLKKPEENIYQALLLSSRFSHSSTHSTIQQACIE